MAKILYFDCFSGISGDMTLGALLSLGVDFARFRAELSKLNLDGEFEIALRSVAVNGIHAADVEVKIPHEHHHYHHHHAHRHGRSFADIRAMIEGSELSGNAKALSLRVFTLLAQAEAKVHDTTPDEVHFHEVGAVDSIVDIVGCAICVDLLQPDGLACSALHEGTGFVRCAHGLMPVPAPATLEVLTARGVPFEITEEKGEMVTPTGASIVAALCTSFGAPPAGRPLAVGYGAGKKRFVRPNLLRVVLLDTDGDDGSRVEVIEANIDDSTPEALGFALDALFAAGALDAYFTPVYMKKNRPGVLLTAVCALGSAAAVEDALFKHTTTLGVRRGVMERTVLARRMLAVSTPYGEIRVKAASYKGRERFAPEYEDVKAAALAHGAPFDDVYRAALAAIEG